MSINNYNELKESSMAFETKDGNILLISKADITEIATKIVCEGALLKTCVILRGEDDSVSRANLLYNIIKEQKDMDADVRNEYLRQIGELLAKGEKAYRNISTGERVSLEGQPAEIEVVGKAKPNP